MLYWLFRHLCYVCIRHYNHCDKKDMCIALQVLDSLLEIGDVTREKVEQAINRVMARE